MQNKFESSPEYMIPNRVENASGELRKVGIEIEYAGLDTRTSADVVANVLGGKPEEETKHLIHVRGSEIGDIRFELDTQYAHPKGKDEPQLLKDGRELLGTAVQSFVPQELVTEPIPMDQLQLLDKATDALADAGAKGTQEGMLSAFGVHFNPEIANETNGYLLAIIRSMIFLDETISQAFDPDRTRNLMGWAQSYTPAYEKLVMDPSYDPNKAGLIADYIEHNKGRNHHLDMLPVFAHLDDDLVGSLLNDELVSGRPAFHFRLPDSRIGEPGWSIRRDWNSWVQIEDFADRLSLEDLARWREDAIT